MSAPTATIWRALEAGDYGPRGSEDRFMARCSAHEDRNRSLSVRSGDDGRALVHCFAGCSAEAVAASLGMRPADLFVDDGSRDPREHRVLPAPRPRVKAPAERPPADELAAFWDSCHPAESDPEVKAWILSRGCDPDAADLEAGVRAIPRGLTLPAWATTGRGPWNVSGHRCAFPVFDATGRHASIRARLVDAVTDNRPKDLAPAGFPTRGLVMAEGVARQMLAGRPPPAWSGTVVVVEGQPDFLSWATNRSDSAESFHAVFGIVSGAWTAELAARIPDAAVVAIRTHSDDAGKRYAAAIAATLAGRCDVRALPGSRP